MYLKIIKSETGPVQFLQEISNIAETCWNEEDKGLHSGETLSPIKFYSYIFKQPKAIFHADTLGTKVAHKAYLFTV